MSIQALIEARYKMMRSCDAELAKIPSFLPKPPPSATQTRNRILEGLRGYYVSQVRYHIALFCRIRTADFEDFLNNHTLQKSFLAEHAGQLTIVQTVDALFDFIPGPTKEASPRETRKFFLYFLCFMIHLAPDLLFKLLLRFKNKTIPSFARRKVSIIGKRPELDLMGYQHSVFELRIPRIFVENFNDFCLSTAAAADQNNYIPLFEELCVFHELLHILHQFTDRHLTTASPFSPLPNFRTRPIREERRLHWLRKNAEFQEIQSRGFGNSTKLSKTYEEFNTIWGRKPEVKGLHENALRITLNLRLRYTTYGTSIRYLS